MDPLAKVIRKKLRALAIEGVKVVFSEEKPLKPMGASQLQIKENDIINATADVNEGAYKSKGKNSVPASNAFVPAAAGIIVAGEVVKDLIGWGISSQV